MTTREAASSSRSGPYMRLAELLIGSRIALALRVVAERGIADVLADGAKSPEDLSSRTGIPAPTLTRLMRSLSYVGVFEESSNGCFSNTDVSAYLRSGADPSLREMGLILMQSYGDGKIWSGFSKPASRRLPRPTDKLSSPTSRRIRSAAKRWRVT